ncbi:hypothetical protein BGZ65_002405, partial [Modicella reniformis]
MYERLKIIFAGWLMLAHLFLKSSTVTMETHHVREEAKVNKNRSASYRKQEFSTSSIEGPTQSYHHVPRQEKSGTTSTAGDLNLERRQTLNPLHSDAEHIQRSSLRDGGSGAEAKLRSRENLYSTITASPLSNSFDISTTSPDNSTTNPIKERTLTAEMALPERNFPSNTFHFGSVPPNLKRSLSVASSEAVNTKSYKPRSGRRRPIQRSQSAIDPYDAETPTSRMTKRPRELLEEEYTEGTSSSESLTQRRERALNRTSTLDIPASQSESTGAPFSRPEPSGRNRKAALAR